jgi:hypothetical protein
VSQHGIAGQNMRRIEEYTYPWTEQTVLVMHSDGINTRLDLAAYPGLSSVTPASWPAVLYRDFARGRDDATVVVARGRAR